ncbi:MAG TPA: iron-sulfur cluster assembly protein [Euzebyales bacterium]|nr:iron-sulfur cluster assembly protein [Euzebyales bacterium]
MTVGAQRPGAARGGAPDPAEPDTPAHPRGVAAAVVGAPEHRSVRVPADPALQQQVERALASIEDPCSESLKAGWSVFDLGLLVDVETDGDDGLVVELTLTDPMCPFFELLEERVCAAVTARTGAPRVAVRVSSAVAWDPGRARRGPLAVRT